MNKEQLVVIMSMKDINRVIPNRTMSTDNSILAVVVIGDLSEEGMNKLRPTGWNEDTMGRADEEHFRQRKQCTRRPRGGRWFAGFNRWQERSLWMQHHESEDWHFLGAREVGRSLFSFCFGFCFHLPMVNNGKVSSMEGHS